MNFIERPPTISPYRSPDAHVQHPDERYQSTPCDVCGYEPDEPDMFAKVIRCEDGLYRCKVCRGASHYKPKQMRDEEATPNRE